jgi:anthranilate synthase
MYLPDQIVVIDNQRDDAWTVSYDFTSSSPTSTAHELTTVGLPRTASVSKYESNTCGEKLEKRDTDKGIYAESVLRAKQEFKVGNLFEVVLSQTFREAMTVPPSTVFRR